eukprot:CAMPEP_0197676038 /NCGR_PEP_ID=MMETSP1338-20131121/86083_1 /TAXON_ID=43686 ORGANISM="Pelagodinium beii, Strain RCC1491" /NCGR_SAMPLE_ID=MMETSP1338 /ASSEMBLY_ACC=CAM_ASM_000754 /LENGTH=42 /DNA_ID= /DNA_START= /DNA_END= /DNA_ORIENTATION=
MLHATSTTATTTLPSATTTPASSPARGVTAMAAPPQTPTNGG